MAINDLLLKGAIVKCHSQPHQFLSNIFLTDKSNGEKRFILNLKNLNKFIEPPHFKMEDYRTAAKLISSHNFMTTIDIKDAYFLISIDSRYRKFLRFRFEGDLFEFCCMPFGLSIAPFCFTKLLKPVIKVLRVEGIFCVNYLDDFLIIADTFEACQKSTLFTVRLLENLGFLINREKSRLTPNTSQKFLGFLFDSHTLRLELPLEKRLKIKSLIQVFSRKKQCKIRDFAKFIGVLTSACPAVKYGWLYIKRFEREKFLALLRNHGNYNATMSVQHTILSDDLFWWDNNILKTYNDIKNDTFYIEIYTDASTTGWGACCGIDRTHGFWSERDRKHHINYLELQAIFFGLKCFASNLKDCNILIRADNTTAISYVNRMGSVQYPNLSKLAKNIWQWCEERNVWLFASYIASVENWQADYESRRTAVETEWELSVEAFDSVVNILGKPEVDLFASRINKKCAKYVSWKKDPGSIAVDAFTVNWKQIYFYAFPPFSLILRMLQKIMQDKAEGIVIVPNWPAQPWYPLFQKLITGNVITFNPSNSLLSSPFRKEHPLWKNLTLVAARLSARHF